MVVNIVRSLIESVIFFQTKQSSEAVFRLDTRKITPQLEYKEALKVLWNNYFYIAFQYNKLQHEPSEARRVVNWVVDNSADQFIKVVNVAEDINDKTSLYRALQYHNRYLQNALLSEDINMMEESLFRVPYKLYKKVEEISLEGVSVTEHKKIAVEVTYNNYTNERRKEETREPLVKGAFSYYEEELFCGV